MEKLKLEVNSGIATVSLVNPTTKNSMCNQMAFEFKVTIDSLKNNKDIKALVIRGEGEVFSSGGNLEMLKEKCTFSKEQNYHGMIEFYRSFLSIKDLPFPTLAFFNGASIGAALVFSLAADFRIANPNIKLGFTFINLNLHPGMGATFLLPKIVGRATAKELLLSGRIFTSEEGVKLGIVDKVVNSEEELNNFIEQNLSKMPKLVVNLRDPLVGLNSALETEALAQAENYAEEKFRTKINSIS